MEGGTRELLFEMDGDETLVLPRRPLAEQDANKTGPLMLGERHHQWNLVRKRV